MMTGTKRDTANDDLADLADLRDATRARGPIIGRRVDPVTLEPIEVPEAEHFHRCAACGGMVDRRDLGAVLAHEGPLPHPGGGQGQ